MNDNKEYVIRIKDLFFAALYHWRRMLVLGIVIALILGAYGGTIGYQKVYNAAMETYTDAYEAYSIQKTVYEDNIDNLEEILRSDELTAEEIYDYEVQLDSNTRGLNNLDEPEAQLPSRNGKVVSNAIIGFVLGIVLGAVVTMLAALLKGKVLSEAEFHDHVALYILGRCSNKNYKGLDSLFRRCDGRCKETNYELIAENVKARIAYEFKELNECKNIIITGSSSKIDYEEMCLEISKLVGDEVEFISGDSILRTAGTISKFINCDAVVLAEVCGASKYDDILREIESAGAFDKPVLGVIVLE